jgi:hypothetical protein
MKVASPHQIKVSLNLKLLALLAINVFCHHYRPRGLVN